MPVRALDHLVLGTTDLDALANVFEALGFRIGTRNRHPWGTENRIIQLSDETFLELITLGEGAEIPPHQPGHFSFGAFVRDSLARAPGLSMLALKSSDAKADAAHFAHEGIGAFAPFHFGRKGKRPDGSETEVAFTLAFAHERSMPDCGFFTCQQHFPQNFWAPAMQQHRNGATGITRVTLVAENPSDHHVFLSSYAGSREMQANSTGIAMPCGLGLLEIISKESFRFLYGSAPPAGDKPRFAGFSVAMPSAAATAADAAKLGLAVAECPGGFTVLPRPDFLTAIRFEDRPAP
ncbi:MAG: VOC family protein [Rhizobiales bacterium]|nr:VOC family protein [Hyphomicrobiales bacterium]